MSIATADLSQIFARKIAEKQLQLPTMPGTAAEVMNLCQQDDTDAKKLSEVVHNDQTIASQVLRVANSAAYAGQVPVTSLQQAVSRLGLQLITEIATAVSVRGRMFGNPACAELLEELWKHSVLTGFFTKEIARMRRRNVDTAFMGGLLHDIGKAVLLDSVDRIVGKRALRIRVEDLQGAVREQYCSAGKMLAEEWQLPDQIREAIVHHQNWGDAPKYQDLAMTVCLADGVANYLVPNSHGDPVDLETLQRLPVLEKLNMYADQLDELVAMRERAELVTEGLA
ncbi:MAG: HDOD domain-containing protein [bacterium]|nr:HDOD domain-containing protein [bacterium]